MSTIIDSLITDRTLSDVQQGTEKGIYTAADLNRVGNAQSYLEARLATVNWAREDIPRRSDMERYLQDTKDLRDALDQTDPLPDSMIELSYIGANQIEQALKNLDPLVDRIKSCYIRAGAPLAFAGSPGLYFKN